MEWLPREHLADRNREMIKGVDDRDLISKSADWAELTAISATRSACSESDLVRSLDPLEEVLDEEANDHIDPALILEDVEEQLLDRVGEAWGGNTLEELEFRAEAMGENYPFNVVRTFGSWKLVHATLSTNAHLFYECCLLVSGARDRLITEPLKQLDRVVHLMAYLSSAALVGGESFWLGHPRPDHSAFPKAISECLHHMGLGDVTLDPPSWSYGNEKDAGIDIVTWAGFSDGLPGKLVLFGQAASGRSEWKSKSVHDYLRSQVGPWLGELHPHAHIPVMFVPWPQYSEINPRVRNRGRGSYSAKSFRDWAFDESLFLEKRLGIVIDRDRLVELAARGVRTGRGDESKYLEELRSWRDGALDLMRA